MELAPEMRVLLGIRIDTGWVRDVAFTANKNLSDDLRRRISYIRSALGSIAILKGNTSMILRYK